MTVPRHLPLPVILRGSRWLVRAVSQAEGVACLVDKQDRLGQLLGRTRASGQAAHFSGLGRSDRGSARAFLSQAAARGDPVCVISGLCSAHVITACAKGPAGGPFVAKEHYACSQAEPKESWILQVLGPKTERPV